MFAASSYEGTALKGGDACASQTKSEQEMIENTRAAAYLMPEIYHAATLKLLYRKCGIAFG